MTRIGIQISSVRQYLQTPEDVLASFRKVSQIGYRIIQVQWISPVVPAEFIRDALQETQLTCVGTQDYYEVVTANLDGFMRMKDGIRTPEGNEVLVPTGQGSIAWGPIFQACRETGVKYGFAEQESWQKDPFACLRESYNFIVTHGIAR